MVDDPLLCVDEHQRDICTFRGLERAELGVVLDALAEAPLAAQAGGVHEHERAVAALEHRVDRIAGRAGNLGDDHSLASEQLVHEARLADVRPAEDRDADRVVRQLGPGRLSVHLQVVEDLVEEVAGSVPV